jgi:HTH-type transcriptional regulator/antitoxin HipB
METHMKQARLGSLTEVIRRDLRDARRERGWSQLELGRRVGIPQAHVSGIETGRVAPRFDTLLDLVRVLDRDLVLVPRALVPVVQALVRDHRAADQPGEPTERPLYAVTDEERDGA